MIFIRGLAAKPVSRQFDFYNYLIANLNEISMSWFEKEEIGQIRQKLILFGILNLQCILHWCPQLRHMVTHLHCIHYENMPIQIYRKFTTEN